MADSKKRPSLDMTSTTTKQTSQKPSSTKSSPPKNKPEPAKSKPSTTPTVKSKGMVDVTNKTDAKSDAAKKTSVGVTTTQIELDNIVEYKGKYYRGVQIVSGELAKILLELDKKTSDNGRSVTGSSVVPEESAPELPSSDNQTSSSNLKE